MSAPWLVRGGYEPHTTPHGGPEQATYFGLVQQPKIAQDFRTRARPTTLRPILQITAFASMDGGGRRFAPMGNHGALVASFCKGSNHGAWFPSGGRAWAFSGHGANSAHLDTGAKGIFGCQTPRIRAALRSLLPFCVNAAFR